jgi:large subunit ribosomal protein L6
MSRIGKRPIEIPEKTEVSFTDGVLKVKGPLGELQKEMKSNIAIKIENNEVHLSPTQEDDFSLALWGTYASHVANMIQGVNTLYQKQLILDGVGYKAEVAGDKVKMQLGFSHPVELDIPKGINLVIEKNVITVSGIDKEVVGYFAALIRSQKKPEPFKGKGFRYSDEVIRRKQGKKSV